MSDQAWRLSPEALRAGLEMAELSEQTQARADALGKGRIVDQNGVELGKFGKCAAETGFVLCAIHGFAKAVDREGKWSATGACEWCARQDWSPDVLGRRQREESSRRHAEELERRVRERVTRELAEEAAAREAIDRAERETREAVGAEGPLAMDPANPAPARPDPGPSRPLDRPVDPGPVESLRRDPRDASEVPVDRPSHLASRHDDRRPDPPPEGDEGGVGGLWVRLQEDRP